MEYCRRAAQNFPCLFALPPFQPAGTVCAQQCRHSPRARVGRAAVAHHGALAGITTHRACSSNGNFWAASYFGFCLGLGTLSVTFGAVFRCSLSLCALASTWVLAKSSGVATRVAGGFYLRRVGRFFGGHGAGLGVNCTLCCFAAHGRTTIPFIGIALCGATALGYGPTCMDGHRLLVIGRSGCGNLYLAMALATTASAWLAQ